MRWYGPFDAQRANLGAVTVILDWHVSWHAKGDDPWTLDVVFAGVRTPLFGGEHFRDEQQAKDAAQAWAIQAIREMTDDLYKEN